MPTNNTKTNKWTKDEVIGPSLAVARTLATLNPRDKKGHEEKQGSHVEHRRIHST